MLQDLLNSYEEELHNNQFEKKEELDFVSTKISETEKLLELIKSENEDVFTDFTPRTISLKNADKIEELTNELEKLKSDKTTLLQDIGFIDSRLRELKSAMNEISSFVDVVPNSSKNVSRETLSCTSISRDKLHLVLSYLPQDPIRAKIELENLLK